MTFKHIIVQQELDLSEHVTMAAECCNIWIEQAIMSTHTMYTHTHAHAQCTGTHTHTHIHTHCIYAMHTATIRKELEKRKSSLLTICNQSKPFSPPMSSYPFVTCYFRSSRRHPAARKLPENNRNRPKINSTRLCSSGRPPLQLLDVPAVQNGWDIKLLPS